MSTSAGATDALTRLPPGSAFEGADIGAEGRGRAAPRSLADTIAEARRQVEICNACRYCEGFCAVFPAITRERTFADGDLTQLANLCHNCRGCYYACQYTAPHEFDLNVPAVLSDLRARSFEEFVWPSALGRLFQRSGVAIALLATLGFAVLWAAIAWLPGEGPAAERGFYAYLSHAAMVAIFLPAFVLPFAAIGVGLYRYWKHVGAGRFSLRALWRAGASAGRLDNMSGGQGQGCNYEEEDAYSNRRRVFHQLTMYGFLLCFASTSSGTIMHYAFDWPAPYGFWTPPKLLGVPGGIMLCVGTAGLLWLKTLADPKLGSLNRWGGEAGFSVLLFAVGLTGLLLYWAGGTALVPALLAIHLGAVLAFFLLLPYSKMVHGFFRMAALTVDAQRRAPR